MTGQKSTASKRILTMTDMAKLAGVSESTVSRALSNHPLISVRTRERIQDLALSCGYSVNPTASSLRSKQSKLVAVLIPLVHEKDQHLSDPFMMAMLAHLADKLTGAGYDMLLSKVATHENGWVERLVRSRRAAGAILIGQSLEHEAIEQAAAAGLPLVVWGARLPKQTYVTIGSDNAHGGMVATERLLQTGRRQIAFLGDCRVPEISQRYEGYLRAHQEAGLAANPALLISAGFAPADAYASAKRLLAENCPFDGVVAASDVIAMSAIRALGEAGLRTPQDVGVVGFDDIEMAAFTTPPLTTVRQDIALGAQLLVETLIAAGRNEAINSVEMPAELVVRGSA